MQATLLDGVSDTAQDFEATFAALLGDCAAPSPGSVHLTWMQSPLGPLVLGATRDGVCLVEFSDRERLHTQLAAIRKQFGSALTSQRNEHLRVLEEELGSYFAGARKAFSVPLVFPGTGFQRRVWQQLQAIPYGGTCSYEDIATAVGEPRAVRAVGQANGLNRIAIVIPCHRVINKSGKLGGYGGGLARKQFLLDLERGELL
jgi:AraC family transcriptional regulator of adaptative response/methylated-DNA-[protein]-cysteine methyltransferase